MNQASDLQRTKVIRFRYLILIKKARAVIDSTSPASNPNDSTPSPDRWLDEHGDALFKYAVIRVSDTNVAEDLVQETLIKAIAGLKKFRGDASVKTWLFQILRNEISNHFRKKYREKKHSVDPQDEPVSLSDLLSPEISNDQFASAIEREEFWKIVSRCYEEIPEHLLQTFLSRLANPKQKIETICNELGIKASNFSVRLFRTRLMLRKCLERSWLKE